MRTPDIDHSRGFYLALPRLLRHLLGERAPSSENNFAEALFIGAIVLILPWLAALELLGRFACPLKWLMTVALLVAVVPSWLIVLYANSLLIKLCRRIGLFRRRSNRGLQHVLVWAIVAACAGYVAFSETTLQWIGISTLTLIAVDLFAAAALPLAGDLPSNRSTE